MSESDIFKFCAESNIQKEDKVTFLQMTELYIALLKLEFDTLDKNKDQRLSLDEYQTHLTPGDDLAKAIEFIVMDQNLDHHLDFEEYL